jgi:dienelactone hydrolase
VDGDYLDPDNYGNVLVEWFKKYPYETSLKPKIDDAVRYLKSEVKVEKIVSYGYCWGSWVGAAYTTHTDPLFHKGHVSFHPTWIVENILKGDNAVDQLAQSVKVPQVLLAAGDDPPFVKPDGSVHKILKARTDIGEKSDFYLFEDQNHGWVHRGDLSNAATAIAVKKSWQEIAIPFFKNVAPLN